MRRSSYKMNEPKLHMNAGYTRYDTLHEIVMSNSSFAVSPARPAYTAISAGGLAKANKENGFTLVEVMIAIAIIGMISVVLLVQRNEIIEESRVSKNDRLLWADAIKLASESEIELRKQNPEGFPFEIKLEQGVATVEEAEVEITEKFDSEKKTTKIWKIDVPIGGKTITYYYFPRPK